MASFSCSCNAGTIAEQIRNIGPNVNLALQDLVRDATATAMQSAQDNCPVDTGRLKGSIQMTVGSLEGHVGTDCEYAIYVHEGARGRAGRPFLENAMLEVNNFLTNHIIEYVDSRL